MRTIFVGIILVVARTAVVNSAEVGRHGDTQALVVHQQPVQGGRERTIDVDQVHSQEGALIKKIEQDNERMDRLIDICPSC
jgi:hypothetical protein